MTEPIPTVRLRPVFVVMAVICFVLFLVFPLGFGLVALAAAPTEIGVPMFLGAAAFVAGLGYAMSSSFQWIELDDGVLRGRRLLTRRMFEKPVGYIVQVLPLNSAAMGPLENSVLDSMLETSNRGYELRFADGSRLGLVRGDMAGLDDFLKALAPEIAARCPGLRAP